MQTRHRNVTDTDSQTFKNRRHVCGHRQTADNLVCLTLYGSDCIYFIKIPSFKFTKCGIFLGENTPETVVSSRSATPISFKIAIRWYLNYSFYISETDWALSLSVGRTHCRMRSSLPHLLGSLEFFFPWLRQFMDKIFGFGELIKYWLSVSKLFFQLLKTYVQYYWNIRTKYLISNKVSTYKSQQHTCIVLKIGEKRRKYGFLKAFLHFQQQTDFETSIIVLLLLNC